MNRLEPSFKIYGMEAIIIDLDEIILPSVILKKSKQNFKQRKQDVKNSTRYENLKAFKDIVNQISTWNSRNIKTIFISTVKNVQGKLKGKNIDTIFSAVVDGSYIEKNDRDKTPYSELYKEAIKLTGIDKDRTVVISNTEEGIIDARVLNMPFIFALNNPGESQKKFYDTGAHSVLNDIRDIELYAQNGITPYFSQNIPPIYQDQSNLLTTFSNKKPVLFLDYDGTLTPIVPDPEKAILSKVMRETISELSKHIQIAIVSGRDMDVVKDFVQLDHVIYAGSHGFRISGPQGLFMEHKEAQKLNGEIENIHKELQRSLAGMDDEVKIERKTYAIAIHYRNVPFWKVDPIIKTTKEICQKNPNFKTGSGKKILEIKPALDWHKGKAVEWILNALNLKDNETIIPVYIGDDITDEDAFKTLVDKGIGILVGNHHKPSAARYRLNNVEEVRNLLLNISKAYQFSFAQI